MITDKISLAFLDDDKEFLKKIAPLAEEMFRTNGIIPNLALFNEPKQFVSSLRDKSYDLLFLDIEMPQTNGIQLAQIIKTQELPIDVIYVSNREDLVFRSLESKPFGFVRKSKLDEDLSKNIASFIQTHLKEKKKLVITQGANTKTILLNDIAYFEGNRKKQTIYLADNKGNFEFYSTFEKLVQSLENYGFLVTSKGVLVNYRYIDVIDKDKIMLTDGRYVPLSRRKMVETKQ
jgi:DNA-binding LytR/AlgR family response regulator